MVSMKLHMYFNQWAVECARKILWSWPRKTMFWATSLLLVGKMIRTFEKIKKYLQQFLSEMYTSNYICHPSTKMSYTYDHDF